MEILYDKKEDEYFVASQVHLWTGGVVLSGIFSDQEIELLREYALLSFGKPHVDGLAGHLNNVQDIRTTIGATEDAFLPP